MKGWSGWSPLKQDDKKDDKKDLMVIDAPSPGNNKCYINDDGEKVCPMTPPDPKDLKWVKKSSKKPNPKRFESSKNSSTKKFE